MVKAGPHGELMTEERHQVHALAVDLLHSDPASSTEPAVRFLEAGHDLMHFLGLNEVLPERLDKTVQALGQTMPDFKPEKRRQRHEGLAAYRPLTSEVLDHPRRRRLLDRRRQAHGTDLHFEARDVALEVAKWEIDYILSFESREGDGDGARCDDEVNRLARRGELAVLAIRRMSRTGSDGGSHST